MARVILVIGHPAAGKTYSLRNLDPNTTVIVDADTKGALPWRGWKKNFNAANKNFYSFDSIARITEWIDKIGNPSPDKPSKVKTLVIDGLNSAMMRATVFRSDRSFSGWDKLAQDILAIIFHAKDARADLDIIITAHVDIADPNSPNAIDRIFVPGKMINNQTKGIESQVLYAFYAKIVDGEYVFETNSNHSFARSPEGCFPATIPNDIKAVIDTINEYDEGGN